MLHLGKEHLSGLKCYLSGIKWTFERQKSGKLSDMKTSPFEWITCLPVNGPPFQLSGQRLLSSITCCPTHHGQEEEVRLEHIAMKYLLFSESRPVCICTHLKLYFGQAHWGLTVGFLFVRYLVECTVEF